MTRRLGNRPSPTLTRKAANELWEIALKNSSPQQEWRKPSVRYQLTSNLVLMRELYKISSLSPSLVRELLDDCENHVHLAITMLRQPQQRKLVQEGLKLPPNHHSIINNINHPLNPSNPNNIILNPAMNLLFQQAEAVQALILDNEIEEAAENDMATQTLTEELLADENLHQLAMNELNLNPEINIHQELGLSRNASLEQIEAACLSRLAENAPTPEERPSHEFSKVAAASLLLLGGDGLRPAEEHGLHHALRN